MSCGTGANAVVLELGYMLESPREFLKFLVSRPHCKIHQIRIYRGMAGGGGHGGRASALLKSSPGKSNL